MSKMGKGYSLSILTDGVAPFPWPQVVTAGVGAPRVITAFPSLLSVSHEGLGTQVPSLPGPSCQHSVISGGSNCAPGNLRISRRSHRGQGVGAPWCRMSLSFGVAQNSFVPPLCAPSSVTLGRLSNFSVALAFRV